jgi:hypothetical protein
MERPVLEMRIGMIMVGPDQRCHEVVDREMWSVTDAGRPWVKLHLKCLATHQVWVHQYAVTESVVVEVDPWDGKQAEPAAAADGGGMTAFQGSKAHQPPRQVSFIFRPTRWTDSCREPARIADGGFGSPAEPLNSPNPSPPSVVN